MSDVDIPKTKFEFRYFVLEIVGTLAALIEEKDPFLRKHSERVANNSANFCEKYKIFEGDESESVYFAGLLHDIGIIAVPSEILQKSDPLNEEEMILIKKHPVRGEKILANLSCLKEILPLVRHHHEATDGSGYPDGLKKHDIPIGARILGLFNYFDSLIFPRDPQRALNLEDALEDIKSNSGRLFDEYLIGSFVEFIESNSGQSEDYLLKKEAASMKKIFTKIIQKFSAGELKPPVMPQIVRDVQAVIKREVSSADELSEVIKRDPVISLRLISIANSPIYRGVQEIRDVRSAIPRLGLKETLNIIIAINNKSLYQTNKIQYKILMDKMWVHALASAYGAELIAKHLNLDELEEYFLMGLTHDIGKIILLKAFSEVSKSKSLSFDAVNANIQEAHIGLGSMLLKRWGFDQRFVNVISHHEDKEFSPETAKEILVVNLANMLTSKIGFSLVEDDLDIAELESAKILKLTPEQLESIGEEVKTTISDVAHLF